jgi:purine catabolism regulator
MPAVVVRTLAEWLAGNGGSLVAGATPPGLERAIEGVARPRRFIQRDLDSLDVHDIVLAAIDAFPPTADLPLHTLISLLAESQAGLIVAGLPPRDDAQDQRPYQTADALAFPLFSVPFATDLTVLARQIDDLLRAQQTELERSVREAQGVLTRARHAEDSLANLSRAFANHTQLTVCVEDEHRVLLSFVLPDGVPYDEGAVQQALSSYAARRTIRGATPDGLGEDIPVQRHLPGDLARAIVPLRQEATPTAYLSLLGPEAQLSHREVALLWRVAPLFGAVITQARVAAQTAQRTPADDLWDVLSGTQPETELAQLALAHQVDLTQPWLIGLVASTLAEEQTPTWAHDHADRLARTLPAHWAMPRQNAVAVVLGAAQTTDEALRHLLQQVAGDAPLAAFVLGLGRGGLGVSGLRQSLREAEQALRAAHHEPERRIMRYADLGVLRLLLPLQDSGKLTEFYQDTLAPLIHADHQDALLATLEQWLTAHGNLTEAARRLNLHRNTLMYRLHRIEELLGGSLDDADRRLALHLALKIWHMQPHAPDHASGK